MPTSPMPPQDAAWLGMERPTNLMVVTAVLTLDSVPDLASLHAVVQERMVDRYPSFRRRPVRTRRPWPRVVWSDDPAFDLRHHLRTRTLSGPLEDHLDELVGGLMGTPLDPDRPPWLMHLVTGPDAESALVVRVHHCVGDGSALVQVLLSLTDGAPETPREPEREKARSAISRRLALRVVQALARVPLMTGEPRTHLRGALGTRKVVARGSGVPLSRVKRPGFTVNDVVLAAVAGGLRRQLIERGDRTVDLRVLVPVDLRPRGSVVPTGLGNHFGMVFVSLPVGEPDANRRLTEAHLRSLRARAATEAVATFVGLTVLGVLPRATQALAVRLLGARATAVVTNVRGPGEPVRLAGCQVEQITFWVPQTGAVGLGISVLSYAGRVSVGVSADARLLPDPRALSRWIEDELSAPGEGHLQ